MRRRSGVCSQRSLAMCSAPPCASFRYLSHATFKLGLISGLKGKLYTLGGVQSKTVDQYDVETDTWANFFPSLRWPHPPAT